MEDPNPNPTPTPAPTPTPTPSPTPAARPEWLPEAHWDPDAATIKPEFGPHYAEVAKFHQTETERQAALKTRKPEDIKIEAKLPEGMKLPDGVELKIDENDPRVPLIRELAIEHGLDQPVIDKLVALDAKMKVEAHVAEMERIAAEDQKLGAKVAERKEAVSTWARGLLGANKISKDEYEELRMTASTAAGVTVLEKLLEMSAGHVPSDGHPSPQRPAEVPIEQRWYGSTQQKAG